VQDAPVHSKNSEHLINSLSLFSHTHNASLDTTTTHSECSSECFNTTLLGISSIKSRRSSRKAIFPEKTLHNETINFHIPPYKNLLYFYKIIDYNNIPLYLFNSILRL